MHMHMHMRTHVSTKWVFFCTKWQQTSIHLDAVGFEHVAALQNVATSYTKWQHLDTVHHLAPPLKKTGWCTKTTIAVRTQSIAPCTS